MTDEPLDLGSGYSLRFTAWSPDRVQNPQYDGLPDVEKIGAIVTCPHSEGYITFAGEVADRVFPDSPKWTVESWDPLTVSPSIDSGCCHGHIREGRWVAA